MICATKKYLACMSSDNSIFYFLNMRSNMPKICSIFGINYSKFWNYVSFEFVNKLISRRFPCLKHQLCMSNKVFFAEY